jgi:pimeloyl-ACP methyl ester carboxylesterase
MQRREFIAGLGTAAVGAAVYQFIPVYAQDISAVTHRTVQANGINLHLAEMGEGPLVVMCHGFPESWYSWRHQLAALSAAGFHAVAPDMRGYGQSDRPEGIDQYTLLHLVGDMVGLLDALGAEQAVIAGHDWGANVATRPSR